MGRQVWGPLGSRGEGKGLSAVRCGIRGTPFNLAGPRALWGHSCRQLTSRVSDSAWNAFGTGNGGRRYFPAG